MSHLMPIKLAASLAGGKKNVKEKDVFIVDDWLK